MNEAPQDCSLRSVFCLLSSVLCLLTSSAMACPFCKEGLMSPGQAHAVSRAAQGYALSIAVLLGIPFLLVGAIAILVVRSARRAARLQKPAITDG